MIFITEKDFFGRGAPIYPIERMNLITGEPFQDGTHILYVNGAYRGDSEIGKLMHDFSCSSPDDMHFELMAERTRYLKENPKGVSEMCKIIEDLVKEEREEAFKEGQNTMILRLLATKTMSPEQIAEVAELPLEEVQKLQMDEATEAVH